MSEQLNDLSRAELDIKAYEAGLVPEDYSNKGEVIEALTSISTKEAKEQPESSEERPKKQITTPSGHAVAFDKFGSPIF